MHCSQHTCLPLACGDASGPWHRQPAHQLQLHLARHVLLSLLCPSAQSMAASLPSTYPAAQFELDVTESAALLASCKEARGATAAWHVCLSSSKHAQNALWLGCTLSSMHSQQLQATSAYAKPNLVKLLIDPTYPISCTNGM